MTENAKWDLFRIQDMVLWTRQINVANYDFSFRRYFECRSVFNGADELVLLRLGAIEDFDLLETKIRQMGMRLLFSKQEHNRASLIEHWYSLIQEYTPKTKVFDVFPSLDEVTSCFCFPIFVKGSRQTHGHRKESSIVDSAQAFLTLQEKWAYNKFLYWQKAAIREYVKLQVVDDSSFPDNVPICYEFRFFFWKKILVGYGPYWTFGPSYALDKNDVEEVSVLATKVADRIDVPFLTVDMAKTQEGKWLVIEVNDGQESGYSGVSPLKLWNNIFAIEDGRAREVEI